MAYSSLRRVCKYHEHGAAVVVSILSAAVANNDVNGCRGQAKPSILYTHSVLGVLEAKSEGQCATVSSTRGTIRLPLCVRFSFSGWLVVVVFATTTTTSQRRYFAELRRAPTYPSRRVQPPY
ncbi:hypothetical protein U1Q18_051121 [Sarracenia purpurea var. burkii]